MKKIGSQVGTEKQGLANRYVSISGIFQGPGNCPGKGTEVWQMRCVWEWGIDQSPE